MQDTANEASPLPVTVSFNVQVPMAAIQAGRDGIQHFVYQTFGRMTDEQHEEAVDQIVAAILG